MTCPREVEGLLLQPPIGKSDLAPCLSLNPSKGKLLPLGEKPEVTVLPLFSFLPLSVLFHAMIWIPVAEDYSVGFGGKFGVQRDRQDKSAFGWDHQEEVQPHAFQTGRTATRGSGMIALEHTQT